MILVIETRTKMLQNKNIMRLSDTTNDETLRQTRVLLGDAAVHDLREKSQTSRSSSTLIDSTPENDVIRTGRHEGKLSIC